MKGKIYLYLFLFSILVNVFQYVNSKGIIDKYEKDIKKFKAKIVPVYIERVKENDFKLKIYDPIEFKEEDTLASITQYLNLILEEMILKNPDQWIWSHNRWK